MLKQQNDQRVLDLIVVGGGINGAGIAADAAGRGLSVGIYDAQDFAGATSSASSKLIHGGLRYLEQYEFRLVAESLAERETLLRSAPHLITPMRFRLPHRPFLRPAWLIRLGLFLYDHLHWRSTLPKSRRVSFDQVQILQSHISSGFEYTDCWVDDARLTLANVLNAQHFGAEAQNYCRVESAQRVDGLWHVNLYDQRSEKHIKRRCRALVNAAGPWVCDFIQNAVQLQPSYGLRLVKGSHIVVPKIHDQAHAYILQNDDKRIVFVIPYLSEYSIIGTTDVEFEGDPRQVHIDEEEINYLLNVVNGHFIKQLSREDIVWDYSGVRPLYDDHTSSAQAITRDYVLALDEAQGQAPLLSVFGGKLTTYRKLAEAALDKLLPFFKQSLPPWTRDTYLPGGGSKTDPYDELNLTKAMTKQYPWLNSETINRLLRQFGTQIHSVMAGVAQQSDMGICFALGVYQLEIDYFLNEEMATCAQDVLWRRTKLGLLLSDTEQHNIDAYIASKTIKKGLPT